MQHGMSIQEKISALPPALPPKPQTPKSARPSGGGGGTPKGRNERPITRTASDGRSTEGRGQANTKRDGGGMVLSQSTMAIDSCTNDAFGPVLTFDYGLLATGKPMSLKEFSKGKSARDLPCLVKVVAGHRSMCELYSFGTEQMFVVLEKKSMPVVTCKDHKGRSSCVVPLNTTSFHLVPYWMDTEGIRPNNFRKITPSELLQSKAWPPVIAVSVEFEVSEHHSNKTIPVGSLLFPKEKKQKSKDQRQWVLHAKSQSGSVLQITPDCNGRFSILACDVRLSLQQALDHLKPPFTMRTVSDCDTLYVNVVTVERVHKEDVFIGMMKATEGTSIDDVSTFSRMAEVPVSLNLKVVTMVPKQQEVLDKIYDFAHSEYDRVTHHQVEAPGKPTDTVLMAPNPAYIDIFMAKDFMNEKFTALPPASSVKSAPSTPLAGRVPRIPLQLSLKDKDEHIYDAVDNYMVMTRALSHQMAPPDSKSARTPFETDSPQTPSREKVSTSVEKDGSAKEAEVDENIAYLKTMQRSDILQLLDAMNLSAYKEAFELEQIDGGTMACLTADMLGELGVSKALHRLRLMKIISGRTSASSFINML